MPVAPRSARGPRRSAGSTLPSHPPPTPHDLEDRLLGDAPVAVPPRDVDEPRVLGDDPAPDHALNLLAVNDLVEHDFIIFSRNNRSHISIPCNRRGVIRRLRDCA